MPSNLRTPFTGDFNRKAINGTSEQFLGARGECASTAIPEGIGPMGFKGEVLGWIIQSF